MKSRLRRRKFCAAGKHILLYHAPPGETTLPQSLKDILTRATSSVAILFPNAGVLSRWFHVDITSTKQEINLKLASFSGGCRWDSSKFVAMKDAFDIAKEVLSSEDVAFDLAESVDSGREMVRFWESGRRERLSDGTIFRGQLRSFLMWALKKS